MKMMRIILLIVFFLCCLESQAQKDLIVISTSRYDVVYRNVPNLIKIGFANMNSNYYLECIGGEITNRDKSGNYLLENNFIIIPGEVYKVTLKLFDSSDSLTRKLLIEHDFVNRDLPSPELYYGAVSSGGSVSWKESRLFVRYDQSVLLSYKFEVLKWKSKIKGKFYSGEGNILSSEFQQAIKKLSTKKEFCITVEIIGEDKLERKLTSVFRRAAD